VNVVLAEEEMCPRSNEQCKISQNCDTSGDFHDFNSLFADIHFDVLLEKFELELKRYDSLSQD
jgi:hypothetical protein